MKVARDLDRKWCGIDKEKEYCEIAEKRIKEISVEDIQKIVDVNEKLSFM